MNRVVLLEGCLPLGPLEMERGGEEAGHGGAAHQRTTACVRCALQLQALRSVVEASDTVLSYLYKEGKSGMCLDTHHGTAGDTARASSDAAQHPEGAANLTSSQQEQT